MMWKKPLAAVATVGLVIAGTGAAMAGTTRFDPGSSGPNAFAYQWVDRNETAAPHASVIQLQWRSPSGGTVSLVRGAMALLYRTDL